MSWSWLLPFTGPFAPSIKSLPSGKEFLLFECGDRTSYKISRLEVIFMGPWGTEPVLPFLYPLTRLVGPHYFRTVALQRNGTEPVFPSLGPLTRLV